MCFYRTSKHKCSNNPITVYKVMRLVCPGTVNSIFHPAAHDGYWEKDVIEAKVFKSVEQMDALWSIGEEVVHAYQTLEYAIDAKNRYLFSMPTARSYMSHILRIVKCEIPPGIEYWLGSYGEIGARKLKIVSINN